MVCCWLRCAGGKDVLLVSLGGFATSENLLLAKIYVHKRALVVKMCCCLVKEGFATCRDVLLVK